MMWTSLLLELGFYLVALYAIALIPQMTTSERVLGAMILLLSLRFRLEMGRIYNLIRGF